MVNLTRTKPWTIYPKSGVPSFELFISVGNLKSNIKPFFKPKVKPKNFLMNCHPGIATVLDLSQKLAVTFLVLGNHVLSCHLLRP